MQVPAPRSRPADAGYTVVELIVVLALVGLLLGLAAPPVERALAWARVRGARDVVVMETARARALAVARGGAQLVLDLPRARAWIEAADTATPPESVGDERRLTLTAEGATGDTVRIAYDGLGLGRMAGRTLRFRSGSAEARLTISGYGRVRAW